MRRKREWFDEEAFWRELYPFMFPEKRFAEAPEQTAKILSLTKPVGKAVLDLCCGPGRCSIALARKGFAVTGVDKTGFLLRKARARASVAGVNVEWVRMDMRDFVRPEARESEDLSRSSDRLFGTGVEGTNGACRVHKGEAVW